MCGCHVLALRTFVVLLVSSYCDIVVVPCKSSKRVTCNIKFINSSILITMVAKYKTVTKYVASTGEYNE